MRKFLLPALLLITLLLQGCGGSKPVMETLEFAGLQLTLQVPPGDSEQSLSEMMNEMQAELERHRQLDPANPEGMIAQLNREANSKSVSFEETAFDFILRIMNAGRLTEGLIDLRAGKLMELWSSGKAVDQPDLLDSALVNLQRCGFISASKSFLIYGPDAGWDTTPYLAAWYGMIARNWLNSRISSGMLQVGPLYTVFGEPVEYRVDLPALNPDSDSGSIVLQSGWLGVVSTALCDFPLVNPLTGQPAADGCIAIVQAEDPVVALTSAMAGLLSTPAAAEQQFAATEVAGLLLCNDGAQHGSADLAARLQ